MLFSQSSSIECAALDINCSVLKFLAMLSDTAAFKANLNSLDPAVKSFSKRIETAALLASWKIMKRMVFKFCWGHQHCSIISFWQVRGWCFFSMVLKPFSRISEHLWPSICIRQETAVFESFSFTLFVESAFLSQCWAERHSCICCYTIVRKSADAVWNKLADSIRGIARFSSENSTRKEFGRQS